MDLAGFDVPAADQPLGATHITRVLIFIPKHAFEVADPRAFLTDGARNDDGRSAEASITINYVREDVDAPMVLSIRRAVIRCYLLRRLRRMLSSCSVNSRKRSRRITWMSQTRHGAILVALVALPEDPDGLDNTPGEPPPTDGLDQRDAAVRAQYADNMPSTGRDGMVYPYVLTITPKYENKNDIVVKVKAFEDMVLPTAMKYTPGPREADYNEGMSKLTIKVGKEVLKDKTGGFEVLIPKEIRIPNGGYLVAATDIGGSGIKDNPENDKDEPKASARTPAQLLYNVIALGLPNLETFLANGGTIDLIAPNDLVISEIMWGSDASLVDNNKSQWIEIQNNSGASILTGDKTHKFMFYGPNETPPGEDGCCGSDCDCGCGACGIARWCC